MPHRTGPGTYKGYESPITSGWPEEIKTEVRKVYGAWRSKNPGESHATKARGARIAWSAARRKFPDLYRQHVKDSRRLAFETKQELKEHPWAGRKTAARIAADHIREQSSLHTDPVHVTVAKTRTGRRHQIADLHETAREQRRWADTADNERISEGKRAKQKAKAGLPIQARDLKEDSKLAGDFAKMRRKKADEMDMEAARIAKVTGS
jgi:hypothetical protein